MPTATLDPVEPAVRDAAQARYATALRQISSRTVTATLDRIGTAAVELPVSIAAETAAEVTQAHFALLTGVDSPAVAPVEPLVSRALDRIGTEAAGAGLSEADQIRAQIEALQRITDELTYGSAAAGAKTWATATGAPIRFWVRVLSPGVVCGLCAAAATRYYKRPDLQPIHDRCDCTIRPVMPDETLKELKTKTLPDWERAIAQEKVLERLYGKGPTGRGSRSRASNVRIFASVEGPPKPPQI